MTPTTSQVRRVARIASAVIGLFVFSVPGVLSAQAAGDSAAAPPAAKPADVASMDAILHSLYDVISGPAGPRDWNRFRSLFVPGARLIPTRRDTATGRTTTLVLSPDDYVKRVSNAFSKNGFYEKQIGQTVQTFGAITQVFSAYASRHTATDPEPFARGINSIQLFNDGTRWYVVTIYWQAEHPGLEIPAEFINNK